MNFEVLVAANVLFGILLFQIKHFICDFPLQVPYMYKNKGTFGHPGGLLHAGVHSVGSYIVLTMLLPLNAVIWSIILGEFITHYLIDWAKMRLNAYYGWQPTNSEYFWWLLGFDQFLHQITYIVIVLVLYLTAGGQ